MGEAAARALGVVRQTTTRRVAEIVEHAKEFKENLDRRAREVRVATQKALGTAYVRSHPEAHASNLKYEASPTIDQAIHFLGGLFLEKKGKESGQGEKIGMVIRRIICKLGLNI